MRHDKTALSALMVLYQEKAQLDSRQNWPVKRISYVFIVANSNNLLNRKSSCQWVDTVMLQRAGMRVPTESGTTRVCALKQESMSCSFYQYLLNNIIWILWHIWTHFNTIGINFFHWVFKICRVVLKWSKIIAQNVLKYVYLALLFRVHHGSLCSASARSAVNFFK